MEIALWVSRASAVEHRRDALHCEMIDQDHRSRAQPLAEKALCRINHASIRLSPFDLVVAQHLRGFVAIDSKHAPVIVSPSTGRKPVKALVVRKTIVVQ